MSLATSAAPVAVRRPATAQLLLPAAGARGTLPDTAAAALPVRTSSTSAGGTAGSAALTAPCAGATGASQLVPAGYRKLKPHFQRAPHSAPPSRALISWRDRKSTRLNSSHSQISYAVFCLKKKKIII